MDIRSKYEMTEEALGAMQNDILEWTDSNHPIIRSEEFDDGFRLAFSEGAARLMEKPELAAVFTKVHD